MFSIEASDALRCYRLLSYGRNSEHSGGSAKIGFQIRSKYGALALPPFRFWHEVLEIRLRSIICSVTFSFRWKKFR